MEEGKTKESIKNYENIVRGIKIFRFSLKTIYNYLASLLCIGSVINWTLV